VRLGGRDLRQLSFDQIRSMVDELLAAHGDWLPAWARTGRKVQAA